MSELPGARVLRLSLRSAGDGTDYDHGTHKDAEYREDCPDFVRADSFESDHHGVYRLLKADLPLPHRKAPDGTLVFMAGDVREWIQNTETPIAGPPPPYALRVG